MSEWPDQPIRIHFIDAVGMTMYKENMRWLHPHYQSNERQKNCTDMTFCFASDWNNATSLDEMHHMTCVSISIDGYSRNVVSQMSFHCFFFLIKLCQINCSSTKQNNDSVYNWLSTKIYQIVQVCRRLGFTSPSVDLNIRHTSVDSQ